MEAHECQRLLTIALSTALLALPAAALADEVTDVHEPESNPGFTWATDGTRIVFTGSYGGDVKELTGGQTRVLVPAARRQSFQVHDIGTDSRGRALAVYTRCLRSGCDLYSSTSDRVAASARCACRVPGATRTTPACRTA